MLILFNSKPKTRQPDKGASFNGRIPSLHLGNKGSIPFASKIFTTYLERETMVLDAHGIALSSNGRTSPFQGLDRGSIPRNATNFCGYRLTGKPTVSKTVYLCSTHSICVYSYSLKAKRTAVARELRFQDSLGVLFCACLSLVGREVCKISQYWFESSRALILK